MEEIYRLIEEKIKASGYLGYASGEEIYDEICDEIEEKENVVIETEYDMNETLNTLLSKLNLKEENKEKILRLGWNKKENNIESKDNVIIIGNKDYIENTNRRIMQKNIEDLTIVDCYKFEDICNNMSEVADKYDFNLNTNGLQ